MRYMDMLTGNTRTQSPTIAVATIGGRMDGRRAAAAIERRTYEDSTAYATMRGLMSQRHGVCG